MKPSNRIYDQVRRNLVAIISLVIAVTSLGYNTWRNEASEYNRNQRIVAIEVLRNVGELHQVVLHRHWDDDESDKGNPRTGWALVLAIHDLAMILESPVPDAAEVLKVTWGRHWETLGPDRASEQEIVGALEVLRDELHTLLNNLD